MEKCNHSEGYLLIYSEGGDEIHADLICKSHYESIISETDPEKMEEEAFNPDPLYWWFSQTMCHEPWPYSDVKILGTVHVWRT